MKPKIKSKSFAKITNASKNIISSTGKDSTVEGIKFNRDIDTILKSRWQGAINIRGIRFQILYSLLRAFELYDVAKGEHYTAY